MGNDDHCLMGLMMGLLGAGDQEVEEDSRHSLADYSCGVGMRLNSSKTGWDAE